MMNTKPITLLYYAAWIPLVLFMFFLCRRRTVMEVQNVPKTPVMVVCNHMSHYDIISLALAIYPLKLSYMAKSELFNTWFLRNLFLRLGAFPVNRGGADRKALRKAEEVLKNKKWALGVFPEGRRSPEAKLIAGHVGPALIALRNDVQILPVGIAGTDKIKGKREGLLKMLFYRPVVTVHVGKPFKLPCPEGKITKEHLEACADNIMRHIAELLPQEYRGVYAEN